MEEVILKATDTAIPEIQSNHNSGKDFIMFTACGCDDDSYPPIYKDRNGGCIYSSLSEGMGAILPISLALLSLRFGASAKALAVLTALLAAGLSRNSASPETSAKNEAKAEKPQPYLL